MRPFPVTFHLYATDEEEVRVLQEALYEFVKGKADRGVAVTATRLASALKAFGNNPLVNQYFYE